MSDDGLLGQLTLTTSAGPPGVLVARLTGELDAAVVDVVRARLDEAVSDGDDLVVDLTDLSFLDSRGTALLDGLLRARSERGRRCLVVVAQASPPSRLLRLLGFPESLLVPTVADAEKALRGASPL